jgi:spoIIIJ-associated protein
MTITETIQDFVARLAAVVRLEFRVDIQESEAEGRHMIVVALTTDEPASFLIGNHGDHLKSLEHLLRLVIAQGRADIPMIALDVNDYKKSRSDRAIEAARAALERVRSSGKPESLVPMTSYERRAVHTELLNHPDIATESIGEEPQRRVVIKLRQ